MATQAVPSVVHLVDAANEEHIALVLISPTESVASEQTLNLQVLAVSSKVHTPSVPPELQAISVVYEVHSPLARQFVPSEIHWEL